jgi:chemotaxis protein CheC
MIALSELEMDALAESFNLTLGRAASVFADIVREEIQLSVPSVEILPREELVSRLEELSCPTTHRGLCCIAQHYRSNHEFETDTLLLFPEKGSLEIVRRMLGDESVQVEQITELEQDALGEIGNIIINSCMDGMADMFGTEVIGTLPGVRTIQPSNLLDDHPEHEVILVARIGMRMMSQNISGYVLFIMDVPSLESFMRQVRRAFGLPEPRT